MSVEYSAIDSPGPKRTDSALVGHLRKALSQAVRDGRREVARELTRMIVAERESTRCWGRRKGATNQ